MDWLQVGQDFLSTFLQLFMAALIPVVVTAIVAWIGGKLQEIRAKRPDVMRELAWVMPMIVTAAQQAKVADLLIDKKEYAIGMAEEWLKSRGWKLDLVLISGIVEQAVSEAGFPPAKPVK
jgi:hypothetical protein